MRNITVFQSQNDYFLFIEEQTNLLPILPAELLSSLPQELSSVLQKEMRGAFLNLAQSQTTSTSLIQTSTTSVEAPSENVIADTVTGNKEDVHDEKTVILAQGMYYVFSNLKFKILLYFFISQKAFYFILIICLKTLNSTNKQKLLKTISMKN